MVKRIVAFPYYGGKNSHMWILKLLPYGTSYIEPYFGSGAVLLNRIPSPQEVANDLDQRVINFFQVLRDRREEFVDLLRLTPYSKYEHEMCMVESNDPVENARRFFVYVRQSFMGVARTWAISPKEVRGGFTQVLTRYLRGIEALLPVIDRLRLVIFENRQALDVIQRYDSVDTVQFLDPPYMASTRVDTNVYAHEMSPDDHKELLNTIVSCESRIAISHYKNSLYDEALEGWYHYYDKEKSLAGPRGKRQEILSMNYDFSMIREPKQTELSSFTGVEK